MTVNRRPLIIAAATVAVLALAFAFLARFPEGNASASFSQLRKQGLLAASRAAGDYLVRMQKPDGSFHYIYAPVTDSLSKGAYNMLRHAGTAYSLYQIHAATHDVRYLKAANMAADFQKLALVAGPEPGTLYLDDKGKAKLGGAGLALVALSYRLAQGVEADRADAQAMAAYILSQQNKDGSYESYLKIKGSEKQGSVSLYYPGEAILGLMKLYAIDRDPRWLASARAGAAWLIASQRAMQRLPPDAWLIQALEALYAADRQAVYLEHALALSEAIATQRYIIGSNDRLAPLNPVQAAARAEGLIAGWRLARAANGPLARLLAGSIQQTAHLLLAQQYTDHEKFPNPARAAGGIPVINSDGQPEIRIDYVQHAMSAMLGLAGEMD